MKCASALARPQSDSTHAFKFMDGIVLPKGYTEQVPCGKFTSRVLLRHHRDVHTIDETRRTRLEMLLKRFGGKLANLNEALGYERTHSQLARIKNKNQRTDRPGKYFEMGDELAREIEAKLSLEKGWMDTPPSYQELLGDNDPRTKVMQLMEAMPPEQWQTAVRLLDALAQPAQSNSTHSS